MKIYDEITKLILAPLYFNLTGNVVLRRLAELEKTQYLPLERLNSIQYENLKNLLVHSYRHVPFYRERFDKAGFDPHSFSGPADINCIPYLTKEDLQKNMNKLVASNYDIRDLIADASGGSTGKPTNFYKDPLRNQLRSADKIRHDKWSGWNFGEKYVTLWGARREFEKAESLKTRVIEAYIYRVSGFNAFDVSEEKALQYIGELKKIRPAMIVAYANVAYFFAEIIHKHKIDLSEAKIKGLISSAETLTGEKRAAIQSAFNCKVLNRYGSREAGLIASECPHQEGMHINSENVFVEIQENGREVQPGETGEIIVTDLWNYGMPLIRYQMGDIGVKSDRVCSCGRGLPMLHEVRGRVSDFIVDSKGGLVHGEYFTHLFYGIGGIEQFQLVQESAERIVLKILPRTGYDPRQTERIVEKIKICLGGDIHVDVLICNDSFVETSGKFRFTVSKLAPLHFRANQIASCAREEQ